MTVGGTMGLGEESVKQEVAHVNTNKPADLTPD